MIANVPESEIPDLREYLFVDAPRVRMLVSQIRGGAPETTKSVTARSRHLRASLKLLEGERASQRSEEDTIALSDLYVSMLEEDADALGMLSDLSDRADKAKFWKRGGLRRSLEPGMLLRVTAPTRLMDASGLVDVWRSFEAATGKADNEFEDMMAMVKALRRESGCHRHAVWSKRAIQLVSGRHRPWQRLRGARQREPPVANRPGHPGPHHSHATGPGSYGAREHPIH